MPHNNEASNGCCLVSGQIKVLKPTEAGPAHVREGLVKNTVGLQLGCSHCQPCGGALRRGLTVDDFSKDLYGKLVHWYLF